MDSSMSSGRPRKRSRRMPGARISPRTRARLPIGLIPGCAAIARKRNLRIEREGVGNGGEGNLGWGGGGGGGGGAGGRGRGPPPPPLPPLRDGPLPLPPEGRRGARVRAGIFSVEHDSSRAILCCSPDNLAASGGRLGRGHPLAPRLPPPCGLVLLLIAAAAPASAGYFRALPGCPV